MPTESKTQPRVIPIAGENITALTPSARKGAGRASAAPSSPRRARFADLYCAHVGIRPEHFVADVYRRTLYPHACWLCFVPALLRANAYTADYDFISEVGEIRSYADYELAVEGFRFHPLNAGWLRRFWRFRISVARMNRLVHAVLRSEHHHRSAG